MKTKDIMVLGLGNYLMGDEGVGCQAIEYLRNHGYGNRVHLVDGGTGGFHLMNEITQHKHVIFIDATLDDHPEGKVRVIQPRVVDDFPHTMSTHEIGLKDLVTSLVLLDQLPNVYLIAVSVKDYDELRITLSPKINESLPLIVEKLDKILAHLEEVELV